MRAIDLLTHIEAMKNTGAVVNVGNTRETGILELAEW